jgi:tripartite ATP-independent transporter DctP family solute receptor
MKKASAILAVALAALCLAVPAKAQSFKLKLGHVMSTFHPYHIGTVKFAELVNERTNGDVVIDVYPASQLGGEREGIEALQLGTLDFQLTSTAPLANFNNETVIFDLPFIFEDRFHARTVLDSDYGQTKLDGLAKFGMIGLGYYENSYFDVCASKPVISPEDMSGLTIRILENNILMSFMKLLNANPVPMAWSEVATAMQNGTIDAINTSFIAVCDLALFKDIHYTYLDILYTPVFLLASQSVWETLPDNYKEIITVAAKEAAVYERQWIDDTFPKLEETAQAGGLTIHRGDKQAWIDKTVKPLYDEFVGTIVPASDVEAVNSFRKTPAIYVPAK